MGMSSSARSQLRYFAAKTFIGREFTKRDRTSIRLLIFKNFFIMYLLLYFPVVDSYASDVKEILRSHPDRPAVHGTHLFLL